MTLYKRVRDSREQVLGDECRWKLVVPKSQRKDILTEFHDSPLSGHLRGFKTLQSIKEYYYWPGMAADVARYVARCSICLQNKPSQQAKAGLMGHQKIVTQPWQLISIDLMGPLPSSSKQNKYLLVVVDYFSKYSILLPMRQATAKGVSNLVEEHVLLKFGDPQLVVCDNGTQFKSKEFQDLMETMISCYINDNHRHWDKNLAKIGFALQTAVHEATGVTPAFLNFGRKLKRNGKDYPDTLGYDGEHQVPDI